MMVHRMVAMKPYRFFSRFRILVLLCGVIPQVGQGLGAAPIPYGGKVAINGLIFRAMRSSPSPCEMLPARFIGETAMMPILPLTFPSTVGSSSCF